MADDPTYGEVDPLADTIRYADIDVVKRRIGLDPNDTTWDTELTQAIISAEIAIDQYLGRSFPDTGDFPVIAGIPIPITQAAENTAIAVLKQTDAPFGQTGSDGLFGDLDVGDLVRAELYRSPLLAGYRHKWGVA